MGAVNRHGGQQYDQTLLLEPTDQLVASSRCASNRRIVPPLQLIGVGSRCSLQYGPDLYPRAEREVNRAAVRDFQESGTLIVVQDDSIPALSWAPIAHELNRSDPVKAGIEGFADQVCRAPRSTPG